MARVLARVFHHDLRSRSTAINGVATCVSFLKQCDWALHYAFRLARAHQTKLSIYHFLESPYFLRRNIIMQENTEPSHLSSFENGEKLASDSLSGHFGEFLDVDLKMREGNNEFELKKCYEKKDFELLVIGYTKKNGLFGRSLSIESFAKRFVGPVVLVGPDDPESYYVNVPAKSRLVDLLIPKKHCTILM